LPRVAGPPAGPLGRGRARGDPRDAHEDRPPFVEWGVPREVALDLHVRTTPPEPRVGNPSSENGLREDGSGQRLDRTLSRRQPAPPDSRTEPLTWSTRPSGRPRGCARAPRPPRPTPPSRRR